MEDSGTMCAFSRRLRAEGVEVASAVVERKTCADGGAVVSKNKLK